MAGPNDEYLFWLPPTKERPIGVGIPRADVQSPMAEDLSRGVAPDPAVDFTDQFIEERGEVMSIEAMPPACTMASTLACRVATIPPASMGSTSLVMPMPLM
ncbi:MAG: hypothetical protein IH930_06385 [Proteobacteria bacterium]|nr:hypothetical protein [Pseudomonadota bacterium]